MENWTRKVAKGLCLLLWLIDASRAKFFSQCILDFILRILFWSNFVIFRVNVGGSQVVAYMQKLLQLKYPGHAAQITLSRAQVSLLKFILYRLTLQNMSPEQAVFDLGNRARSFIHRPRLPGRTFSMVKWRFLGCEWTSNATSIHTTIQRTECKP